MSEWWRDDKNLAYCTRPICAKGTANTTCLDPKYEQGCMQLVVPHLVKKVQYLVEKVEGMDTSAGPMVVAPQREDGPNDPEGDGTWNNRGFWASNMSDPCGMGQVYDTDKRKCVNIS